MDWTTLLAYLSGSVDEELLLRNEYLVAENRILRDQITGRIQSDKPLATLAVCPLRLAPSIFPLAR